MITSNALTTLAKIGSHVCADEVAHVMGTDARTAHDELGKLIDEGLIAESTYYRLTEEGIAKLRAAGVMCSACRGFLHGFADEQGRCSTCVEHNRQSAAFRERAAKARASAERGKDSKPLDALGRKPRAARTARGRERAGHRGQLAERDAKVLELRKQGWTNGKIAVELGLTYTQVTSALTRLRKHGAHLPNPSKSAA